MKITYAIGDIHGQAEALEQLLDKIQEDMSQHASGTGFRLIQMGDMIDRGPNSREVIDICKELPERFPDVEVHGLIGNHEYELIKIYQGHGDCIGGWFPLEHGKGGGVATLRSYGCKADDLSVEDAFGIIGKVHEHVHRDHINYFAALPSHIIDDNYLFVHSGIVPGVPLEEQNSMDFIALYGEKRHAFLASDLYHGKIIVHAHTPRRGGEILPNRVNVDAGAGYNLHLQCAVLPEVYNMGEVRTLEVEIDAPENWIEPEKFKEV